MKDFDAWWQRQNEIWRQHDALAQRSNSYGKESGQDWYHFALKDGRHVFLNMETGEERELPLTEREALAVGFGSKLWRNLPFLASLYS